jgi:hypothetical protein
MRSRYPKFDKYISKEQIYLNTERKIYFRRYSPGTQFIFFKKEESQYKQVLTVQTLRNKLSDPKRDKITCVKIIGKDIRKDTDLLNLKYKMNIQNLLTSASVSVAAIIEKKNKRTNLSK